MEEKMWQRMQGEMEEKIWQRMQRGNGREDMTVAGVDR
jgi:hypothetical protein